MNVLGWRILELMRVPCGCTLVVIESEITGEMDSIKSICFAHAKEVFGDS